MKKHFLTGLATLLPLAITIWIVLLIVRFLTHPFMDGVENVLMHFGIQDIHLPKTFVLALTQLIILTGLFGMTVCLGFVARQFLFHQLIRLGDNLLTKIPLVNKVYKTSKDIIVSLFQSNTDSFKQVVMVPFPKKTTYSLGLITSTSPEACQELLSKDTITVFLPMALNPTTGYLVIANPKDLIFLSMKSEDAIKYVVSCGMIQPPETTEKI